MIVPEYWAESRIQEKFPERENPPRQITVRRFGWSDISQAEAQRHADERVREAFDRVARGDPLPRRERKVRYNGADGLPIREQIIERVDDCVVTRNSYGARCFNSPDVLFADIDFLANITDSCVFTFLAIVFGIFSSVASYGVTGSLAWTIAALALMPIAFLLALDWGQRLVFVIQGGPERIALRRIESFIARNQQWHLRIYRTPLGMRLIAMHKLFDPRSEEVDQAFAALRVDRTYVLMCQKQNCFRARLTAKPWRIGITERLKPRGSVWPIDPRRMNDYNRWIAEYESLAVNFSACRFVKAVGSISAIHPKAKDASGYHDAACNAALPYEIA